MQIQELNRTLGVKRIVIWGLRSVFNDSYRFVQGGFYLTLQKLGIPVIWVDDAAANVKLIEPGDLIFLANRAMQHLPLISGVKYCLHNVDSAFFERLDPSDYMRLQILTHERFPSDAQKRQGVNPLLDGAAYFESESNVLYQCWGAPLLAKEFYSPMNLEYKKSEYFVGTIWDNELGQGNSKVIPVYQAQLQKRGIEFLHVQGAPERINPLYVRHAAVGASIVGNWQREVSYAPCRLFKAVSFGRLGLINSNGVANAHPWAICNENIPELVDYALSLSPKQNEELIIYQQSFVAKETYESKIHNILQVLLANSQVSQ